MMTMLKGIGRENDFIFVNGKIQKRNTQDRQYNDNDSRQDDRREWTEVRGRNNHGNGRGFGGHNNRGRGFGGRRF